LLQGLDRFKKLLEAPPSTLERGLALLKPDADLSAATQRLISIVAAMVTAIEGERTARLRARPVSDRAMTELRDAVEKSMLEPPGGIFFFRGFTIMEIPQNAELVLFTSRFTGLSKAQFVDPPMEWESVGFTKHYVDLVTDQAGRRVWNLFTRRHR